MRRQSELRRLAGKKRIFPYATQYCVTGAMAGKAAGFLVIFKCVPTRWQWVIVRSSFKCTVYSDAYGATPR